MLKTDNINTVLSEIKQELLSNGFKINYNVKTKQYVIFKKSNVLNKLKLYEEEIIEKGYETIVDELNKLIEDFNDKEKFLETVANKHIYELNIFEFEKMIDLKIENEEIEKAYKMFWDTLTSEEKRLIKRQTNGLESNYDGVTEYIFQSYLNYVHKFQYKKREIIDISEDSFLTTREGNLRYTKWLLDNKYINTNNEPLKCIRCNHNGYLKIFIEKDENNVDMELKAICPNCNNIMGYYLLDGWVLN